MGEVMCDFRSKFRARYFSQENRREGSCYKNSSSTGQRVALLPAQCSHILRMGHDVSE